MQKTIKISLFAVLALAFALGASFALAVQPEEVGNIEGSGQDDRFRALGEIRYSFNPEGYDFWFTPTQDIAAYVAGHSYHNMYRYEVEEGDDSWCGPVFVPDRMPYNAGGTVEEEVYYKILDETAETYICGSE